MTSLPSASNVTASSFAPYQPPPDEPVFQQPKAQPSFIPTARPWLPPHASSYHIRSSSYQDGGVPSLGNTTVRGIGVHETAESQLGSWETSYGMRVDILASFAYILGPLSALVLLILEQRNDYIRFHAYQSALLTGPLMLLIATTSILHFPDWTRSILRFILIVAMTFMAIKAYQGVVRGLYRSHIPYLGDVAERWLEEE